MWKITRNVEWIKIDAPSYHIILRYIDNPIDMLAEICQWYLEGKPEIKKYEAIIYNNNNPIACKTFTSKSSARKEIVGVLKLHR